MPTRKLSDLPRQYCTDREHEPPAHMVYENGLYEHECPSCGNKIRFTVNKPTFQEPVSIGIDSDGEYYSVVNGEKVRW